MTDEDKVFALTELLNDVIHTLEMKQYDIEDATLSHECVTDADKFHKKMIAILYPNQWQKHSKSSSGKTQTPTKLKLFSPGQNTQQGNKTSVILLVINTLTLFLLSNVSHSLLYALSTTMENTNILYTWWGTTYGSILSLLWKSCWTNQQQMTELQKDSMLEIILQQVQQQITYLVSQDLIEESLALYKEWEEHFDNDITELEIVTVIDLTTIWWNLF